MFGALFRGICLFRSTKAFEADKYDMQREADDPPRHRRQQTESKAAEKAARSQSSIAVNVPRAVFIARPCVVLLMSSVGTVFWARS
jgi:hypothetical protein